MNVIMKFNVIECHFNFIDIIGMGYIYESLYQVFNAQPRVLGNSIFRKIVALSASGITILYMQSDSYSGQIQHKTRIDKFAPPWAQIHVHHAYLFLVMHTAGIYSTVWPRGVTYLEYVNIFEVTGVPSFCLYKNKRKMWIFNDTISGWLFKAWLASGDKFYAAVLVCASGLCISVAQFVSKR
jgi:hypothetical protein